MTSKIVVVPYNPNWPQIYATEAAIISQALGDNCVAIHHIGSTAVPGLIAKPKIDVIVAVKNQPATVKILEKIGIEYRGEYNIPMHYGFRKRGSVDLNLHVYEADHPEIELNLLFRDHLRVNSKLRDQYAELKMHILQDNTASEKINSWFASYTLQKGKFIRKVLQDAEFNRIRILKCNDNYEWQSAELFGADATLFNSKNHVHLALYQGVKIIGYAHIYFETQQHAEIRMLALDDLNKNQGLEKQFSDLINKWLKNKNY